MVCISADKTGVQAHYGWFQLKPALSMVGKTVLLAVQSADKLAANRSTEETIRASGDSGWSLSIFHCKINSYANVCSYEMVITSRRNTFECWLTRHGY